MADDAPVTAPAPEVPAKPHALTCQRCGTAMDLRDPAPGTPWAPQQFWVCPRCGRHFWTTHPAATVAPPKAPAPPKAAAAAKPAVAPATPEAATPAASAPGPSGPAAARSASAAATAEPVAPGATS